MSMVRICSDPDTFVRAQSVRSIFAEEVDGAPGSKVIYETNGAEARWVYTDLLPDTVASRVNAALQ